MRAQMLTEVSTEPLEALIGRPGELRPVAAAEILALGRDVLLNYCHKFGIYQIPTLELLEWLEQRTRGRNALEICAGHGDIGRLLGIRSTDLRLMERPEIQARYAAMGQPLTLPPERVETFDALDAIRKYEPEIVIGAWASEYSATFVEDRNTSPYGVREQELWPLPYLKTYILIGTHGIHGTRLLCNELHTKTFGEWIVSRSQSPVENVIYAWEKGP